MKKISSVSASALMVVAAATLAYASGGGEGGGEHVSPWMGFLWQVVNFAILVTVLFVVGKKPITQFFKERTENIEKGVMKAREAREIAQKALDEIDARFASKDKEIREMIEASERSGQKERDRLIEEGERMSKALVEQARRNIEFEFQHAQAALKAEAVSMALELAESKIKAAVVGDQQGKLFEDALKRLEDRS